MAASAKEPRAATHDHDEARPDALAAKLIPSLLQVQCGQHSSI